MLPRKCSLVIWRIPFQSAPNKKKILLEKEWIRPSYSHESVREHSNKDLADRTKQTGRSNFQRPANFTRISPISDCELFTDNIRTVFIKNILKDAIVSVEATGKDSGLWALTESKAKTIWLGTWNKALCDSFVEQELHGYMERLDEGKWQQENRNLDRTIRD